MIALAVIVSAAALILLLAWLSRHPSCPRCGSRSWQRDKLSTYLNCRGCGGHYDPETRHFVRK